MTAPKRPAQMAPAVTKIRDRLLAECRAEADRDIETLLRKNGVTLNGSTQDLITMARDFGIAAAFTTLRANGWLRDPGGAS